VSFLKRRFYLRIPSELKYILVYDYDMVTYRKALPALPAPKTVEVIQCSN
jgi:hypothetical protein